MSVVAARKVDAYNGVIHVFETVFREVKEQSKKKPETTLNPMKVGIINKILNDVKKVVEDEPEAKFLDLLDDESLPQMGDAVMSWRSMKGR